MCTPATPPIHYTAHAAHVWADTLGFLSGYLVTVVLSNGDTLTGELLGDGATGRYVRILCDSRERTLLARSVTQILVL